MSREPTIYDRISREFSYTQLLVQTARDVALNHLYFDLEDAKPITLFDFDVIYGSLLSLTAGSGSLAGRYGPEFDLLSTIPAFGADQLRRLLPPLDHYTFPPGAEVELYRWVKIVLGKLGEKSDTLIKSIEGAKQAADPVEYFMNQRGQPINIIDLLETEIAALQDLTSDSKLLDLLRRKWVPSNELLGKQKEAASTVAYKLVLSSLNVERQRLTYNNFNDALNAGYTVKVFNSEGSLQGQRVIPTLISGTEPIATLNLSRWLRGGEHEIKPRLFASVLYFRISQSLKSSSDGSSRQISDLADQLFKRALKFSELYKETLTTIKRRCPTLDDAFISSDDLLIDLLAEIQSAKSEFVGKHSYMLQSEVRQSSSDKVSLVNRLLTTKLKSQLTSGTALGMRQALQEISKAIRIHDDSGESWFWTGTHEVYKLVDDLPTTALERAAFDLTFAYSAPETLTETFTGSPVDQLRDHNWGLNPKVYLTAHPRNIGALAILRLEAERTQDSKHRLTLRWVHESDYYTIWINCQRIMAILVPNDENVNVMVRSSQGDNLEREVKVEDLGLFLEDAFKVLPNFTRGIIRYHEMHLEVHFEALNDYERQVILSVPDVFDSRIIPQLAEQLSEQIRPGISTYLVRNILVLFCKKLFELAF